MTTVETDMLTAALMPWDELESPECSGSRWDASAEWGRDPDRDQLPEIGQRVDGRYRLDAWLGEGGMGVVFRATDLRLEREVAVKLLRPRIASDPARSSGFLREARAMARLRHPNIAEIYDVGQIDRLPFIVMPYDRGADLADWADRHGGPPLATDVVVGVLGQVCSGLAALHRIGLVHGDIKPTNILVSAAFEVVVTDFGLARRADEREVGLAAPGTPGYVAPELIAGDAVDASLAHRADIYSLGVAAYWLLTGHMPVDEDEGFAALARQLDVRTPPCSALRPDLPRHFDGPVLRALAPLPHQRPDAEGLRRELFAARDRSRMPGVRQRPFVMIVDDDRIVLEVLERVVRSVLPNPEVVALQDAEAALSIVESRPPSLVITDLQMPRVNGVELVAALRGGATTHDVPVVVLSGVGGAGDRRLLETLGVYRFLVKPVASDLLRDAIRGALARGSGH